jgi:arsenate reductase
MKNLLFVCVENSNRSQMAQAFAKIHGKGQVASYSAGSKPSGKVNPKAIHAMQLLGYDLTTHISQSIHDFDAKQFEYVVTMGCGDACPWIAAKHREDWDLPDPKNMTEQEFLKVRDEIEQRIKQLLSKV